MKRLGYTRFVAQGGDWGAVIVDLLAVQAPPELLAIHSNMPGILPPEIAQRMMHGGHGTTVLYGTVLLDFNAYQLTTIHGPREPTRPQSFIQLVLLEWIRIRT